MARLEERFGVKLASGQDKLKGEIFRIGHFGLIDPLDILGVLAALELVLADLGAPRHARLGRGGGLAGDSGSGRRLRPERRDAS